MTWHNVPEYDTLDEMWFHVADELASSGQPSDSRDGDMREVCGYSGRLLVPSNHFLFNPVRKMHPSYAAAELFWYLSGSNNTEMMEAYAPQYKRFTAGSGDTPHEAWGAYGHRWSNSFANTNELFNLVHEGFIDNIPQDRFFRDKQTGDNPNPPTQLQQAAMLLKSKPNTRQCVITCWEPKDLPHALAGDKNDIPCTLTIQFRIFDGRLCCIVNMRSNDVWLGLPYDTFCFTSVQILLAEAIGVPVGWYQLNVGSMHLYERNLDKLSNALDHSYSVGSLEYRKHYHRPSYLVPMALEHDAAWRKAGTGFGGAGFDEAAGQGSLLQQAFWMMRMKWETANRSRIKHISNKSMIKYIEEVFNVDS